MLLTVATLITALAGTVTDTTVAVRPGVRLELHNDGGDIDVGVWAKNAVRIAVEHSHAVRVMIERTGDVIDVKTHGRRAAPGLADFRIVVPTWMPVNLSAVHGDIRVRGTLANVLAETIHGDMTVDGGVGIIRLGSLQGAVRVGGAKGRIELTALNDAVYVSDVEGDVRVEAVNGDVNLERVRARSIDASTVNGDIAFLGPVLEGGRYRLASHQGDLTMAFPDRSDAKVSIATFNGDFDADFPVEWGKGKRKHRFAFTLGNGSALVDLETFAGTIRLRRELKEVEKELRNTERQIRRQERVIRKARAPRADPDADEDEDEED